jgi:hypothetical protein
MSQLILDNQLDLAEVAPSLRKWITFRRLHDLRPGEMILDDRVPEILATLKQPTFVTIDHDFWQRRWCHPKYCIVYFALSDDQQELLPGLLRRLWRRPEFRTRAGRMGKVMRVALTGIAFWQFQAPALQRIPWDETRRRKR